MNSFISAPQINTQQIFKIAVKYGLVVELVTISLIAIFYFLKIDRLQHQSWFSSTFMLILTVGLLISFKAYSKQEQNGRKIFSHHILLSFFMGIVIGSLGYLTYYIEATFIDPEFSERALIVSRQHWEANNYSNEAIANQVELTESFHNPAKWGFISGLFILALTSIIGLVIATIESFVTMFK